MKYSAYTLITLNGTKAQFGDIMHTGVLQTPRASHPPKTLPTRQHLPICSPALQTIIRVSVSEFVRFTHFTAVEPCVVVIALFCTALGPPVFSMLEYCIFFTFKGCFPLNGYTSLSLSSLVLIDTCVLFFFFFLHHLAIGCHALVHLSAHTCFSLTFNSPD